MAGLREGTRLELLNSNNFWDLVMTIPQTGIPQFFEMRY
jgi:hypothetical protein